MLIWCIWHLVKKKKKGFTYKDKKSNIERPVNRLIILLFQNLGAMITKSSDTLGFEFSKCAATKASCPNSILHALSRKWSLSIGTGLGTMSKIPEYPFNVEDWLFWMKMYPVNKLSKEESLACQRIKSCSVDLQNVCWKIKPNKQTKQKSSHTVHSTFGTLMLLWT